MSRNTIFYPVVLLVVGIGILSPRIFAMRVIMALVTTAMTGPLLTGFQRMKVSEEAPDRLVRP